jgi:hypothetical protein
MTHCAACAKLRVTESAFAESAFTKLAPCQKHDWISRRSFAPSTAATRKSPRRPANVPKSRFPPLQVFVRRPPECAAAFGGGRHPKTFTKRESAFFRRYVSFRHEPTFRGSPGYCQGPLRCGRSRLLSHIRGGIGRSRAGRHLGRFRRDHAGLATGPARGSFQSRRPMRPINQPTQSATNAVVYGRFSMVWRI